MKNPSQSVFFETGRIISSRYHSNCAAKAPLTGFVFQTLCPDAASRNTITPSPPSAQVSPLQLGRDGRIGNARCRFPAAPALWKRFFPAVFVIAFAYEISTSLHPAFLFVKRRGEKTMEKQKMGQTVFSLVLTAPSVSFIIILAAEAFPRPSNFDGSSSCSTRSSKTRESPPTCT